MACGACYIIISRLLAVIPRQPSLTTLRMHLYTFNNPLLHDEPHVQKTCSDLYNNT